MTSNTVFIMKGWQLGFHSTIADALRTDCDITVVDESGFK
jgi:hypothetical protein